MHAPPHQKDDPEKKQANDAYSDGRKNELTDIKAYFKTIVHDPDKSTQRKELIKKIIAYTTLGADTSRFLPEITMSSATKDLVQKKLIFLFLTIYSATNRPFSSMAINTFIKDTSSPNPNIRALAIRHLSNLRFKSRDSTIMPILMVSLNDFNVNVQKSSVMGITKLIQEKNYREQEPSRNQDILQILYSKLKTNQPDLICTLLEAINEIEPEGIAVSKKLFTYLLSKISTFSELQLVAVLSYLELYDPKTVQEASGMLNVLYPKCKSSLLSVSLGIIKIFLKGCTLQPELIQKTLEMAKDALISFINVAIPEVEFVALKHIILLIQNYETNVFVKVVKTFYIGGDQPTYIKSAKIRIIQLCTRKSNISDNINELSEYLSDETISKDAINSLDRLMLSRSETEAKLIIKSVLRMVQCVSKDFLFNNAMLIIRNYLRCYKDDFGLFANSLYRLIEGVTDNEAKCAMIEIIGDYGDMIEDAIELIVWENNDVPDAMKISLLRANVKLFFKRPLEMINIVPNMFRQILQNEDTHLYVRDYAAYLYRGLEAGPAQFKQIFTATRPPAKLIQKKAQQLDINTLEVMYGQPAYRWLIPKDRYIQLGEQQLEFQGVEEKEIEEEMQVDMVSKFKKLEVENFSEYYELSAERYEECWEKFDIGSSITRIANNIEHLNEENLQELFHLWRIQSIASSENEEEIKLYLYCQVDKSELACMHFAIQKEPQILTLLIKSQNQELAGFISKYIEDFLHTNEII